MILQLHLACLSLLPVTQEHEGGGFNPLDFSQGGNAFWTWLIFLAALVPIWKLVMGPITRSMEARDAQVRKAMEEAKQASADAVRARAEIEKQLGETRAESLKLLAEARARAEAREREMKDAATQEAKALLEGARRAIQAEQEKALAAIRDEVVELSIAGARAVLERNVGTEDDKRLVASMVGRMTSAGSGKGPGR
jgi:F-type H+-transporting ATPase subunit b